MRARAGERPANDERTASPSASVYVYLWYVVCTKREATNVRACIASGPASFSLLLPCVPPYRVCIRSVRVSVIGRCVAFLKSRPPASVRYNPGRDPAAAMSRNRE